MVVKMKDDNRYYPLFNAKHIGYSINPFVFVPKTEYSSITRSVMSNIKVKWVINIGQT